MHGVLLNGDAQRRKRLGRTPLRGQRGTQERVRVGVEPTDTECLARGRFALRELPEIEQDARQERARIVLCGVIRQRATAEFRRLFQPTGGSSRARRERLGLRLRRTRGLRTAHRITRTRVIPGRKMHPRLRKRHDPASIARWAKRGDAVREHLARTCDSARNKRIQERIRQRRSSGRVTWV